MVMVKVSEKIAQLSILTAAIIGRAFIPSFKLTVNFKNPKFLLPRTRVVYRCFGTMAKANGKLTIPSSVVVSESISLTDKEKEIFDHLLDVVRHYNLVTQLRVAGGWVRDKLLGKECNDIDIVLDDMLGKEFCEKINGYMGFTGGQTQEFGVIQSNPDRSKYVETARMRLFDVWIDFVKFGSTADQDAYRRDLTINSLFYNINTCSVEDFTGRGLDDLKSGKIVTPLPPKEMFLDDGLRVLRAIRFSTMLDFEMADEVKVAAADNDVKSAIADKISRERIGHEIDLMLSGNEPVKAMDCISELGLFWVVFKLPPNFESEIPELDKICVSYIYAAWKFMRALKCCTFSDEQRRLYLYAALFLPLRKTVYGVHKQKIITVNHIFKRSLKLKTSDAKNVVKLHSAVEKLLSLIPFIVSSKGMNAVNIDWKSDMIDVPDSLRLRVLLGLILTEIKDLWRAALMLTVITDKDCSVGGMVDKIKVFEKVEEEILKLGLEEVWEVEPLVNGRDVMNLLLVKQGHSDVGEWRRKLIQWQLAYPSGDVHQCVDWLMRQTQLMNLTS